MRLASIRTGVLLIAAAAVLPGCTKQQLQGQGASYLIIENLTALPGKVAGSASEDTDEKNVLESDVVANVSGTATVVADGGRAVLRLGLKDPGTSTNPSQPTSTNFITVTRYNVRYLRSDGRNAQGVDVPYAFDGAATGTVTDETAEILFTLVRVQAKQESPLKALWAGGALSTLAEVTFYGHDQAGRAVSIKGVIGVNFANYGD